MKGRRKYAIDGEKRRKERKKGRRKYAIDGEKRRKERKERKGGEKIRKKGEGGVYGSGKCIKEFGSPLELVKVFPFPPPLYIYQ